MTHWADVLPLAVLDVPYEALVSDVEAMSRRMVDFLDLAWEDACLKFYLNDRPVRTASAEQVRRPIHSSSIGQAKRWAEHLAPLIALLDRR